MPHWTDPPTGQVPAVLDRRTEEDGTEAQWSAAGDTGPAWREHSHEWDDSSFDPSLLADEETRVGALEETPLEERRPWEFDDLTTASADEDKWEAEHDAAARAAGSWWSEDDDGRRVERPRPPRLRAPRPAAEGGHGARTRPNGGWPRSAPRPCAPRREPGRCGPAPPPGARCRAARVHPARSTGEGTGRNLPVAIATGVGLRPRGPGLPRARHGGHPGPGHRRGRPVGGGVLRRPAAGRSAAGHPSRPGGHGRPSWWRPTPRAFRRSRSSSCSWS